MRNDMDADNGCFGHGGFGGQYMLADPQSQTVVTFFSVLETIDAGDNILGTYSQEIVDMMTDIIEQQRQTDRGVKGY
eukprot:SAG11_NODE_11835_length_736_cov_0.885400_1_plen_76_part_10